MNSGKLEHDATILAGDVGGTKTLLEAGTLRGGIWRPVFGRRYEAAAHVDFHSVLRRFLLDWTAEHGSHEFPDRACFGVAGPTLADRAQMTNLPWVVDGPAISAKFGIPQVRVINDFAAAASGVELLRAADLVELQRGDPLPGAPRLVIGAGTGLGIAHLIWTGTAYQVIAGEGGHIGFAPTSDEQMELWRHLHERQGRVTAEDIISGPGLARIHAFLAHQAGRTATIAPTPAAITQAALDGSDDLCAHALDLFMQCYGEVAGNCALGVLARGGVYVTGGIAPKTLAKLKSGGFLAAFNAKGTHSAVARQFPVSVVTNERIGLMGCAVTAGRR